MGVCALAAVAAGMATPAWSAETARTASPRVTAENLDPARLPSIGFWSRVKKDFPGADQGPPMR